MKKAFFTFLFLNDTGNLQIKMLEKIEELTQIILKQDEQIQQLPNDLNKMKK